MPPVRLPEAPNLGLLVLRAGSGLLMATHGVGKAQMVLGGTFQFADPIGIGQPASLVLAAFAELVCALLVAAGLFTRLAAIPLIVTMLVAAFVVHGADPLAKKELALMYLACFTAIALLGPGRFSLDRVLLPRLRRRPGVRA